MGAGRRQAKEKEAKPVRRPSWRELRPKPARLSRRSLLSQMPAARQVRPKRVRTTAQRRTFFRTKWRQIPPHIGELRARMLLLLSACPTSNPTTQQLLGWYGPSFLIQPQFEGPH